MLSNQASVTVADAVEPSSSWMPKVVPNAAASMPQAIQLLAPPINLSCGSYNSRAKSNHGNIESTSDVYKKEVNDKSTSQEHKKQLNLKAYVRPTLDCGYSNHDRTNSSVSSLGNSKITIPSQVWWGEFYSTSPSRSSNADSTKDTPNSVRMKVLSIKTFNQNWASNSL